MIYRRKEAPDHVSPPPPRTTMFVVVSAKEADWFVPVRVAADVCGVVLHDDLSKSAILVELMLDENDAPPHVLAQLGAPMGEGFYVLPWPPQEVSPDSPVAYIMGLVTADELDDVGQQVRAAAFSGPRSRGL